MEFDEPENLLVVPYVYCVRNTAIIVTDQALDLLPLQPRFVKVRRHWWQFWRSKPE